MQFAQDDEDQYFLATSEVTTAWYRRDPRQWYEGELKCLHIPVARLLCLVVFLYLAICCFLLAPDLCNWGVLSTWVLTCVAVTVFGLYGIISDYEHGYFPPTWTYTKRQGVNAFWCGFLVLYNSVLFGLVGLVVLVSLFLNLVPWEDFFDWGCVDLEGKHSFGG